MLQLGLRAKLCSHIVAKADKERASYVLVEQHRLIILVCVDIVAIAEALLIRLPHRTLLIQPTTVVAGGARLARYSCMAACKSHKDASKRQEAYVNIARLP